MSSQLILRCPQYEGAKPLTRRPLVHPEVGKSAAFGIGFLFSFHDTRGRTPLCSPKFENAARSIFRYAACGAVLALAGCAPVELRTAQGKLERAQAAMQRGQYLEAKRLAEQAEVDAKLAWSKTETAKAQMAVTELEQGRR
jgi:hypothetical protein